MPEPDESLERGGEDGATWAVLWVQAPPAEQPAIWAWSVTLAGQTYHYPPDRPRTQGSEPRIRLRRLRVDVQDVLAPTAVTIEQPWLVRCYLEACLDGLWVGAEVAGTTSIDREGLFDGTETVLPAVAAQDAVHRAGWHRMRYSTLPRPSLPVRFWTQYRSIAEWCDLDRAAMADLFADHFFSPAPLSDLVPRSLVRKVDTCHETFRELQGQLPLGTLPEVIRQPLTPGSGPTMLEMVRRDGHETLAAIIRNRYRKDDW